MVWEELGEGKIKTSIRKIPKVGCFYQFLFADIIYWLKSTSSIFITKYAADAPWRFFVSSKFKRPFGKCW